MLKHSLTHETAIELADALKVTLVLTPCYSTLEPHTAALLSHLQNYHSSPITVHHVADVAKARCFLATLAYRQLKDEPETEWVLWLDSDVSINLDNLALLYRQATEARAIARKEADDCIPPSLSARYLSKVTRSLEAVLVPTESLSRPENAVLSLRRATLPGVLCGLGCFLQPVESLMAVCDCAPNVALWPNGEKGYRVCCTPGAAQFSGGPQTWWSEAWDYCDSVWHEGSVYLSDAVARHSTLTLAECPSERWPEGWPVPVDSPDVIATRREPLALPQPQSSPPETQPPSAEPAGPSEDAAATSQSPR